MSSPLTEEQNAAYARDGFIIVRGLFDAAELDPLYRAYQEDPTVNGSLFGMVDDDGSAHPICIWTELGDDIIGMVPRLARMVDATEELLGEPCYHWHSKITVKPSGCEARIDWHQDYYSWYDDGLLFPDMLSVGIAVEPATRANGCLQVIPGSHRIGRMDHHDFENFERRRRRVQQTLGLVHCEMDAGDAVFFHCNTLHGSAANATETSRMMLFVSYNAVSNEPIPDARGLNEDGSFMNISAAERAYRPLDKLPDTVLASRAFKSAFGHTRFKQPRIEEGGEFRTRAVELE
ncbi:MAG TPA: phytanoyl-CoA dioxygenase family protein [Acidobacteriota bacterium]|nr:phytanoyl-CoA dioxygenase family protein [Acidobacteriota bacterium]